MLALHTGRPVKMVYTARSFFGHVAWHPATLHYEHGATRDWRLVFVPGRILLERRRLRLVEHAVVGNAASLGVVPTSCPTSRWRPSGSTQQPAVRTMRGFAAVQACFAYESQMDKLAAELGMDPVDLRASTRCAGDMMPTGQLIDSAAPVAELLRRVQKMRCPRYERHLSWRHCHTTQR